MNNAEVMRPPCDIARIVELLLVENHVLKRQQSTGLTRGVGFRYETYPRFLPFDGTAGDGQEPA